MSPEQIGHLVQSIGFLSGAVYFIVKARAESKRGESFSDSRYAHLEKRVSECEDDIDELKRKLARKLRLREQEATGDVG